MSLVHEPLEREQLNPEEILRDLNVASARLNKESTKLAQLTKEYEGVIDKDGEITFGICVRYETAVEAQLMQIVESYEKLGKRPPGEDIRLARARAHIRKNEPELYISYLQALTEMKALRSDIAAQKQVISGKQSVLNGLKAIGA